MKISLNWIKEYVALPTNLTSAQIAHDLTMATVEVEDVETLSESLSKIVLGKIESIAAHPNADKLKVVSCRLGETRIEQIVCGGSNLKEGMNVAVSLPGAKVRWHGEGDWVEVKNTVIRKVESFGMICAASEIGLADLFPSEEESEIMDLSDFHGKPGQDIAEILDLQDDILEIDNKSLTNRPDLWGHYGIARELSAFYGVDLKPLPNVELESKSEKLTVSIDNPEDCRRFTAIRIEEVKPVASPYWLRSRLARLGQRSLGLFVDLTNYVTMAMGQPSHVFDADKLSGGIRVQNHPAKTPVELLNGEILELDEKALTISDDKGPIALAGIMGGGPSSVTDDTTEIILEMANFAPLNVRRTGTVYGMRTEASSRFEKGLHPQLIDSGRGLMLSLMQELQPHLKFTEFVDCYPSPKGTSTVEVPYSFLNQRLGKNLPEDVVKGYLNRLGFLVELNEGVWKVEAPYWRSTGDISLMEDVVEEVARLHGYESFEFVPPSVKLDAAINQLHLRMERNIKEYLAFRGGMQEVWTYPWIEDQYLNATGMDGLPMLTLHAAPSPDTKNLQPSLIPAFLKATASNLRYIKDFRIFNLAPVFLNEEFTSPYNEKEKLPKQPKRVAAALVGDDAKQLFFEAKGILESMGPTLQLQESFSFAPSQKDCSWADYRGHLEIHYEGSKVGDLGVLSARSKRLADIKRSHVVLFEIDVDALQPRPSRENEFQHLPEYPQTDYDLSLLFDEHVHWSDVEAEATKGGELIQKVEFVDEYRGSQVPKGKKSLTLRLLIGSEKETLTSEQIEKAASRVLGRLKHQLSGEIRTE